MFTPQRWIKQKQLFNHITIYLCLIYCILNSCYKTIFLVHYHHASIVEYSLVLLSTELLGRSERRSTLDVDVGGAELVEETYCDKI